MKDNIKFFIQYILKFNFFFSYQLRKIKSYKILTKNELEKIKLEKIKLLLSKSQKSIFYKNLYKTANIDINCINSLEDIKKLPIITKEMIKGKEEELLTINKKLLFKGFTSGSTGSPLTVFYSYLSVLKENAYVWYYRENNGLRFKDPVISLRGNLTKNELFKFDPFTNTLYLSSYNLNNTNINLYYEKIKKFKPKAFLGYPSSIYLLAQLFKENSINFNIPLVFTSSETLYENQKDFIEKEFNCKICDWYGNAERTIALQKEDLFYEEPYLYSINEFESDYVITTNLINDSFPLIRYKVDDSFILQDSKIKTVLGRNDDFIILKDGTKIGRIDHIFKGLHGIKFAQIIQNKINEIDINIVIDNFEVFNLDVLKKKIKERLGEEIIYTINYISEKEIIYMNSGKFKMVVNNVK